MFKNRFDFEYDGKFDSDFSWRDNPYYLTALQVKKELALHDGCVNTICWSEDGEYLLSGSDDRRICLTQIFPECAKVPIFSQKLPADSNVFVVRFLPRSNNREIIVGFKCGCVLKCRTDAPVNSRIQGVYSHKYAVYDVLTFPDQPTCFMTLSHDQSVVCFDTRQPFGPGMTQSTCNQRCRHSDPVNGATIGLDRMVGCARMNFQFPVTAGDVHPIESCRRVALGCADGFVRLFDLRRFTQSTMSPTGDPVQPLPYQLTRPVGLPAQLTERRAIRLDYGPAHITAVQFEPIYSTLKHRYAYFPNRKAHISSSGGRHLLVSHMYAPVFLFNLAREEVPMKLEAKSVIDWLPTNQPEPDPPNRTNGTTARPVRERIDSDLDLRIALAFFHWLESQRSQRQSTTDTPTPELDESSGTENSRTTNTIESTTTRSTQSSGETDSSEAATPQSRLSPLELLTEEYVMQELSSAPRAQQRAVYRGRRSCRTVIKAASFWGYDHILSGSECGHVIVWNRWSAEPVHAIRADTSVVNRIAPHPVLPMFACSGIDRTVKLIEPDPSVYEEADLSEANGATNYQVTVRKRAEEANRICTENSSYMVESLRAGSLNLDRLARLRTGQVLRNILRRLANTETHEPLRDPPAS